jgi:uncharacterized protein (DUF1800 family)
MNVCAYVAAWAVLAGPAVAQLTDEVTGVGFGGQTTLQWAPDANASSYHVYRGNVDLLASGIPGRCHGFEVPGTTFETPAAPDPGQAYFYLITALDVHGEEGVPGVDSAGSPRALLGSCTTVMRNHVLDRVGFGWDEWSAARLRQLGIEAHIAEQLTPRSINEQTNNELRDRLLQIDPAESLTDLLRQHVVRGTYARRQLEQQTAEFWANHFNTFWLKIQEHFEIWFPDCESPGVPQGCDDFFPFISQGIASEVQYREIEQFRSMAFYASFRDLLEVSATSPAMIPYLDSVTSVVGNPNENYARELLELHTMGVAGGYVQADIEELARALTGWSVCKKTLLTMSDPMASCLANYWDDTPGMWVAHFDPVLHDCTTKTVFAGTPHEFTIPDTCGNPSEGLNDLDVALDGIVAHPSTARFISGKILERFVSEDYDESMVDALVAVWNDDTNPAGVGDVRAVLSAALNLPEFLDPDRVRDKIKTPLEHAVSAMRATRGATDGLTRVLTYLSATQHRPHYNPVPTGWPEDGLSWINTNNMLDRQKLIFELLQSNDPEFSADPISLLEDNGVSTAPGNAVAIVDFFADAMFGGALTPAERQAAVDYLNTDDDGVPTPYDDRRIGEVVAILAGYPQFQEQ